MSIVFEITTDSPDFNQLTRRRTKSMNFLRHKLTTDIAWSMGSLAVLAISHLYHHAHRARFTKLIKNAIDALFRQLAFNLSRGTKVLASQRQWCPI